MFLLCGCNSKKSITGQVVEVYHGTGSNDTQFVLHTKEDLNFYNEYAKNNKISIS